MAIHKVYPKATPELNIAELENAINKADDGDTILFKAGKREDQKSPQYFDFGAGAQETRKHVNVPITDPNEPPPLYGIGLAGVAGAQVFGNIVCGKMQNAGIRIGPSYNVKGKIIANSVQNIVAVNNLASVVTPQPVSDDPTVLMTNLVNDNLLPSPLGPGLLVTEAVLQPK